MNKYITILGLAFTGSLLFGCGPGYQGVYNGTETLNVQSAQGQSTSANVTLTLNDPSNGSVTGTFIETMTSSTSTTNYGNYYGNMGSNGAYNIQGTVNGNMLTVTSMASTSGGSSTYTGVLQINGSTITGTLTSTYGGPSKSINVTRN